MPLLLIALSLGLNFLFLAEEMLFEALSFVRRRSSGRDRFGPAPERALTLAVLVPNYRPGFNLIDPIYTNESYFLGVEPESIEAWAAARELETRDSRVVVVVQRSGLAREVAWRDLARRVLASEQVSGLRYEGFVLLEGGDGLSPGALNLVDRELRVADLVQLPLLPRRRGRTLGAAAFADDTADLHRELWLRSAWRGALPTRGAGTALSRELLAALLERPDSVFAHSYALGTEAYRLGYRSRLAYARKDGRLVGVEQTGPDSLAWAIRRRARFVFEAGLEAWPRFGAGRGWRESYFFWRDRRWLPFGLAGLMLSVFYVFSFWIAPLFDPRPAAPEALPLWIGYLALANLFFTGLRLLIRMRANRLAYGWESALTLPLRLPLAGFLRSMSQWRALGQALRPSRPTWRG